MYDFTIVTDSNSGSRNEYVCNPFAQRSHPETSCACLFESKSEFELEQVISLQLRNKITVVRKG